MGTLGTLAAGVAGADLLVKKSNIAEYYRLSTAAVTSTHEDYKQAASYTAKKSKRSQQQAFEGNLTLIFDFLQA